jgi:hypothetical protein
MLQVLVGLADERKVGKRAQRAQLSEGRLGRRGSLEDARMRYDGEDSCAQGQGMAHSRAPEARVSMADRARSWKGESVRCA